jgi:ATP-binding cassette subfamily C protein
VLLAMFDTPVAPIYLLAVFLIHPHLGFIVATTGGLLLAVALINQKLTAVAFARANAFGSRANLQAEAMARNAQVINAMGMIPEGVQMWGSETAESLKAQVAGHDRNIFMTGISKFLRLCTQIGVLGWGAWLALESQLTGGMVIAASIVGSRALAPLEGTIEGWRNFVQARSAYARIKTLLQNSPLNAERLRLPRPEGRLNVERILYVPPPTKKVILNGVTFQLDPGESLAIVGSSGAGKSTLARMLVGSIVPTAGNVRLDMMDLRNWDPRQFGENVGYLPQDVQLFPATIKANISRMREDASDEAIFDAAEMADVHEMISEFPHGYETVIGLDGSPLSGGQKQRIGLARAFYGNPRLIVLDEPNSNLDARGDRALATALLRAKEKGLTVVAVTQRPSLLKNVDKIMILQNGGVQAFGKREDVIPLVNGKLNGSGRSVEGRSPGVDELPSLQA